MRTIYSLIIIFIAFALFTSCDKGKVSPVPIADFTFSGGNYTPPCEVTFTNTSSGEDLSFTWDFGDGSFSSETNPVHTYPSSGTYTVRLTAKNDGGSNEMVRTLTVKNLTQVPVANFNIIYYTPDTTAPCSVYFENTSLGDSLEVLWDFGDGSTSTGYNDMHIYPTAGTYTVKLLVRNRISQNEITKTVIVKAAQTPPVAVKIDYIMLIYVNSFLLSSDVDTKITATITDILGNQLVKSPVKLIREGNTPIAMSLGWDTEAPLTDLSATYRIVISIEYQSQIVTDVLTWVPRSNNLYPENVALQNSNNVSGYFHAVWTY